MWSHYADSHQGFVIGFDSQNSFFKPGNGKAIDGLKKVMYSENRPKLPLNDLRYVSQKDIKQVNTEVFFTKSEDWSYEKELRILADPASADHTIPLKDNHDI